MPVHYPEIMRLRLPRGMPEALALAAGQHHTTPTEWARQHQPFDPQSAMLSWAFPSVIRSGRGWPPVSTYSVGMAPRTAGTLWQT
jgi:hypothetical protein